MFQAIAKFFQNLFKSPELKSFEEWCLAVFTAEKPIILGALKDIATAAVLSAEKTSLDSASKRSIALGQIESQAKTIGITAGSSILSLALEMAVQALRGDK